MTSPTTQLLEKPGVQLLLLLTLTAAAYAGVVHAGFVWDDHALVVRNSLTGDLRNLPAFFHTDLWAGAGAGDIGAGSGYYRPLLLCSLAMDRLLAGLNPALAHLHSLCWHLAAIFALHRLLRGLVGPAAALCGATLFALHPVQSEAVVWVSARNDPMAAAFFIGGLVLLQEERTRWPRALLGGTFALMAMLSKESALLFPLILLALDLGRWGRPGRDAVRITAATAAVLLAVTLRALSGVSGAALPEDEGWRLLMQQSWESIATYTRLLVVPWPLSAGRDLESLSLPLSTQIQGGITLLLLFLGLPLVAHRHGAARQRLCIAGLTWAIASFVPSILAIADKGLLGERYLYLPLAGLALAIATTIPERRASLLGLPFFLLLWMGILHQRLPDWRGDLELWAATLRDTPSTFVEASYGHALRGEQENLKAFLHFRAAILGDPPVLDVCPNTLAAAMAAGRPDLAVQAALETGTRGCAGPEWMGHHAVALAVSGQWEQAVELAGRARQDPARRADLVLAASRVIADDPDTYCALLQNWSGTEAASAQIARILALGSHPGLSDRLLDPGNVRFRCP